MDDYEAELLKLIYTRIGMIMEDASTVALELGGPRSKFDLEKVSRLNRSIRTICALSDAARAMRG